MPTLTDKQLALLKKLEAAFQLGASARAFKGKERATAHSLGKLGLAELHGTSWWFWRKSSFWSITDFGRSVLVAARSNEEGCEVAPFV